MRAYLHRMLLAFGTALAVWQFRPTAGRWRFRSPKLWILGPREWHLVNDAQKTRIERIIGGTNAITWLIAAAAIIGLVLYRGIWGRVGNGDLVLFSLFFLLLAFAQNGFLYSVLRPPLKDLPRITEEETRLSERLRGPASLFSTWYLSIIFVTLLLLLALSIYQALVAKPSNIASFIAMIMLGGLVFYVGAILRAKFASPRQT